MKTRKFLALLLCLAVTVAALGVATCAEEAEPYAAAASGAVLSPDIGDFEETGGPDRVDDWVRQPLPECDPERADACPHTYMYRVYTGRIFNPTCFAPGGIMIEWYCRACNAFVGEERYYTSSTPAVPHKFVKVAGIPKCAYCGIEQSSVKTEAEQTACAHDALVERVIEARTCGEFTCKVYYCSKCGQQQRVVTDRADGYHHFEENGGTVVQQASCSQQGIRKISCDCGQKTLYRLTSKLPHQLDSASVPDSCTSEGHCYTCDVCGETVTVDHIYSTPIQDGCKLTWSCEKCGYSQVTYKHLFHMNNSRTDSDANGHTLTCIDCGATKWEPHNMEPVRDSKGKVSCKLGTRCTVCGWEVHEYYSHKMVYECIDATHHRGYCTHEGCEFTIESELHDWGEAKKAKATCVKCGAVDHLGKLTTPAPAATKAPEKPASTPEPTPTPTVRPKTHTHKIAYVFVDAKHHHGVCTLAGCNYTTSNELHDWGAAKTATDSCVKCGYTVYASGATATATPAPVETVKPAEVPAPNGAALPGDASLIGMGAEASGANAVGENPAAGAPFSVETSAAIPAAWKEVTEKLTFTVVESVAVPASAPVSEVIVRQAVVDGEYDAFLALTVEWKADRAWADGSTLQMYVPVEVESEAFKLVRVEEDGTLTEIKFSYEDGVLSFDAEEASLYLLVPVE